MSQRDAFHPTTADSGQSLTSTEFRGLMGEWSTGVTVVTSQGEHGPSGFTANAITSVSLTPPLLLICFDLSVRTLEAVRRSGRCCLNFLAADQVDLSTRFAGKDAPAAKFAECRYEMKLGVPVLAGVVAYLICQAGQEIAIGDHVVHVARPLRGGRSQNREPLVFFRSGYRQLVGGGLD
ncbi:MAG: flavin reductase [Gemmatimonas sp.]|nr:flavin reductase [Gemmatimonas sp.]